MGLSTEVVQLQAQVLECPVCGGLIEFTTGDHFKKKAVMPSDNGTFLCLWCRAQFDKVPPGLTQSRDGLYRRPRKRAAARTLLERVQVDSELARREHEVCEGLRDE